MLAYGNTYDPLNLEEFFKEFPILDGTHKRVSGKIKGVPVYLELPIQNYNRTSLNWGGPSWTQDFFHSPSGIQKMRFVYSKYGSTNYPSWSIIFPSNNGNIIRSVRGF